jgi:hypothetical protein
MLHSIDDLFLVRRRSLTVAAILLIGLVAGSFTTAPTASAQGDPHDLLADLTISMLKLPNTTSPGAEIGSEILVMLYNQGTTAAAGFNVEFVVSTDRKVPIKNAVLSTTFKEDAMLPGGRVENIKNMEPEDTHTFSVPGLTMVSDAPIGKIIFVCAVVDPEHLIDEDWRKWPLGIGVNRLCTGITIVAGESTNPPSNPAPPADNPPATSPPRIIPPTVFSGDLTEFDADDNCTISDIEFFTIMDGWTSLSVADGTFFTAIDAWMTQTNICTNASVNGAVSIGLNSSRAIFSASDETLIKSLTIYESSGRRVSQINAPNKRVTWDLRDNSGNPVANGVYFANVTYNTLGGVVERELRKFVVMR